MGLDTITLAMIFTILGFGIFISFKILNFTDLTVEASFTFGAAISVLMCNNNMAFLGLILSFFGGCFAGLITALLHTKLKLNSVLSGILTLTAFYSVNLWVTSGTPSIIIRGTTIFKSGLDNPINLVIAILIVAVMSVAMIFFFKTKLGLSIRACGDNENMIGTLNVSVDKLKIIGLMLANGLCAFAGALFVNLQGYYDSTFGTGMMVVGVATIIIGEAIIPNFHHMSLMFIGIFIGSIVYRIIYALVIEFNNGDPTNMKFITSVAIVLCILLAALRDRVVKRYVKNR